MSKINKVKVPTKWKAAEVYAFLNMRISALESAMETLIPGFHNLMEDDDALEEAGLTADTLAEMRDTLRQLKAQLPKRG